MSVNHYLELPHGFDCIDPTLFSIPSTSSPSNHDRGLQPPDTSATPFVFDPALNFGEPLSCMNNVDSIFSSPGPSAPESNHPNDFPRPNSPSVNSSQDYDASGGLLSFDTFNTVSLPSFISNYEPHTVQSACPSPMLSPFNLASQQARATSQPPEEHSFQDLDDTTIPAPVPSMSFHRVVQPRGKRAHTYQPYARGNERGTKRKTPAKGSTPTSAPKLVPLGRSMEIGGNNDRTSSVEDRSHNATSVEESSSPRVSTPIISHAKPTSRAIEAHIPTVKDIIKDLKLDEGRWHLMQTPLSLKLASYTQSLARLCTEMHSSLYETLAFDYGGGNLEQKRKLEREVFDIRAQNCALTRLHENLEMIPMLSTDDTSCRTKSGEKAQDGAHGLPAQDNGKATPILPKNGLDIRRLNHDAIRGLLDLYGLPYSPDQFLHEKKLLLMRFLGLGEVLMHRVLD